MTRTTERPRRLVTLLAILGAASAMVAAPAGAVLDEGGGAPQSSPTAQVQVERFDWSDAGIGLGIGAAAGAMVVGTALVVRRHRITPHDAARPAAR